MQINKPFTLSLLLSAPLLHAQWTLVDDMENGNNWTGLGLIAADPDNATNQVFAVENTGTRVETYLTLPNPIPDGTTGTLFFRFRSTANNGLVDWVAGTSDVAVPTNWPDYEGYVRLAEAGSAGDIDIDARNGGGFTEVGPAAEDTWINVWLVLDNTADTTDVYFNTTPVDATSAGTLSLTGNGFRNGTTDDLVTLLAINNDSGTTGYLDDVYLDLSGENLTHPLSGDTDSDGLNDLWETNFFGDLSRDGTGDFDTDNLTDAEEFDEGTDPTLADTDGDTLNDDVELLGSANSFDNSPTNPLKADSDGDGFDDAIEGAASSDPNDETRIPTRPAGFQLVENFEGVDMVVGATFDGINGWNTNLPEAISVFTEEGSTDQVGHLERLDTATISNPVSKSIDDLGLQILEGTSGTLFMQVLASSGNVDNSFGLSDVPQPSAFGDFEAQGVLFTGNSLRARDAAAFRDQALFAENTWMNVWVVADNASDQVKIYVESPDGLEGQIEITDDGGIDPFDFRNGTSDRLSSILLITALGGEAGSSILVDNIYVDPTAANLTRPVPSKGAAQALSITTTSLNANGDLVITFTPGGDGYILTSSPDLATPFEEDGAALYDGSNTFTIPAASLGADRYFYRVEQQ
ncbi:hypothetical protein N9C66_04095 [Akkermansiaceae bacterium]|nr:hypothetical protein [Akkermansiaceae bacterium]MDA9830498.1 hypothetical protein [Akkermansiaceae bacterium]